MDNTDRENNEPPTWVERLCTVVRRWPAPGATITNLFLEAAPDLSDRVTFFRLVSARLRRESTLVNAWESFSADTRGAPSAYFRDNEAGVYDHGYRDVVRYEDRADACADYLLRFSMSLLVKK
jgi:hypothetical protein